MSTNPAEWIMAAATVVTRCFVAWQSWLLRESLESPFGANLQERQITVCAQAIKAKGALQSVEPLSDTISNWKALPKLLEQTPSVPSENQSVPLDNEMVINPDIPESIAKGFDFAFASTQATSNQSLIEMRAALAELRIYSNGETSSEIDRLTDTLPSSSAATFGAFSGDAAAGTWIGSFNDKFSSIEQKCRSVMLGEKKGLI